MMNIRLICVGKIKEKYLEDAINEYTKRLKPLCSFQIVELKEINSNDTKRDLIEEGKNILKNISDNDYVITMEIEGKELSSVDFSCGERDVFKLIKGT